MLDLLRFQSLVRRLGGRDHVSETFRGLAANYGEPHRAYHNAGHIADCLRQFDLARHLASRPDEIEAALWYHDAIYDLKAKDNEELSAALAAAELNALGVEPNVLRRIAALILVTKHDREPQGGDEALLIDVDLSILGREPDVFATYDAAIRQEYSRVPEDQYGTGRAAVLEGFLKRPRLYRTPHFHERFETPARRNLEAALAKLRASDAAR